LIALLLLAALAGPSRAVELAGAVVRSKEYIVRRGGTREEEFSGDVRYEAAGTRLTSDWALFRPDSKEWSARGRVALRKELEDGVVVAAKGERARYNTDAMVGSLEPAPGARVELTRQPPEGEPDRGEGARLDWAGEKWAELRGGARVSGPRLQAQADVARYDMPAKRLALRGGRPVARKVDEEGGWTTALKADEIDAADSPRRIEARGKVKGWLVFKDEKKLEEKVR
jgi:hypothetical protein